MSFADYLRERISNDYKNLIIQKLEEIRVQTEQLKNQLTPSFEESHDALRRSVQSEVAKIQEMLDRGLLESQERVSSDFRSLLDQHISNWYQADVRPFDQQLEVLLSDIVSNVPVPPKTKNEDLASLSGLVRKLDQQNTQSEILNTVMMHIADWVERAVLFVVKGEQASGWAALGLGNDWNTERVRAVRIDLNKSTVLKDVIQSAEMACGSADTYSDNGEIFLSIGSRFPATVIACPIKVRGKIAGILYADVDSDLNAKPDLPELLYLSTRAAGFAIDLLPLKPKTASAPVQEIPKARVSPPPVPEMEVTPPPPPPPPVPASLPSIVENTAPVEPVIVAEPPEQVEEMEEVEQVDEEVEEGVQVAEADEEEEDEAEGTVIMPAIAPPLVVTEEEQKLHDDAKRFARLLVSEIKLYNEAQVAAGREHRDLYERLREDIERSRRMYQERVPTQIHSSTNYFYEELVRTLANGDPTLLGM